MHRVIHAQGLHIDRCLSKSSQVKLLSSKGKMSHQTEERVLAIWTVIG